MDKTEATNHILMTIEMVEESAPFTGRTKLLNTLSKLQDLIVLYKRTDDIYDVIINEAEKLVKKTQGKLDEKAKGG